MARTLPCSPAQRRFWFLQQLRPQTSAYHLARQVRIRGALDRPEPYEGRVTVLACTERPPWTEFDPQNGWGKLALRGVELHVVPGHHTGLYREPALARTVEILDECLRRARGD